MQRIFEHRHEKTCLRCVQLHDLKCRIKDAEECSENKGDYQQLICVFVFAHTNRFSHDAAHSYP